VSVQAVIQAGGKGTRLVPVAANIPKPLVRVGGVPLVERLLRQVTATGVRDVTVITGWLGEQIEGHLQSLRDLPSGLDLKFLRESKVMGNIGALGLLRGQPDPYLFLFGDLLTNLDFASLLEIHRSSGADATLTSHYEDHRLTLGELVVAGDTVTDYQEKPLKRFLICSGIAVFEPQVLDLIDGSRPFGISDLIRTALQQRMHVVHWTHGAFWMDINTPEAKEQAEAELTRMQVAAVG
jgi:NDP-sugar pyrophosphorylase family protein